MVLIGLQDGGVHFLWCLVECGVRLVAECIKFRLVFWMHNA